MAEKDEVQEITPEDSVSKTEVDYAAELKTLKEAQSEYDTRFKDLQKTLSKRDSTISKLAQEKESLELEKLSDSERAEAEKAKAIEERDSIKAETDKLRHERDLAVVLSESKLDPEAFGSFIRGDTVDEMRASAKGLNDAMTAAVEQKLDTALKGKYKPGDVKKSGDGPGSIEEQILEARKTGNTAEALRLQLEKTNKQSE